MPLDELPYATFPQREPDTDESDNRTGGRGLQYEDAALSPEYLSTLLAPALLVWGDRDPYFPLEFALEMYRALPDAQLWVVPGQGHTPVWESWGGSSDAARIFPAVVREFLIDRYPK